MIQHLVSRTLGRNWGRKQLLLQQYAGISPWEDQTSTKSLLSMGVRKKAFENYQNKPLRAMDFWQFYSQENCLTTFLFAYLF